MCVLIIHALLLEYSRHVLNSTSSQIHIPNFSEGNCHMPQSCPTTTRHVCLLLLCVSLFRVLSAEHWACPREHTRLNLLYLYEARPLHATFGLPFDASDCRSLHSLFFNHSNLATYATYAWAEKLALVENIVSLMCHDLRIVHILRLEFIVQIENWQLIRVT